MSDSTEGNWTCSECGEEFTEENLGLHMLTHLSSVDQKPAISNQCEVVVQSSGKKNTNVLPTKVDELHRLFAHS